MAMLDLLQSGANIPALGLSINQLALGAFFTTSGGHKLFVPARHATMNDTMHKLGIPFPNFNAWFVSSVEFLGGLALLSGVLAPFASLGLFIICLVAILTDGRARIASYSPMDKTDYLCDVLYLPEVLYLVGLLIIITNGPGYSFLSLLN